MKIKIIVILAAFAMTWFASFSTSRIASEVLTDETEKETAARETLSEREVCEMLGKVKIIEVYTAPERKAPEAPLYVPDVREIELIAKVIYNEARGCTKTEQAAVAWCILNRVDDPRFGNTVEAVVTAPYQFAFAEDTPVMAVQAAIAEDVLRRWHDEKIGLENVGRVLPAEYCFFWGDNERNYFRTTNGSQVYFEWTLPTPYGEG